MLRAAELLVSLGCRQLEVVLGENPAQARELLGDGARRGCAVRYHYGSTTACRSPLAAGAFAGAFEDSPQLRNEFLQAID